MERCVGQVVLGAHLLGQPGDRLGKEVNPKTVEMGKRPAGWRGHGCSDGWCQGGGGRGAAVGGASSECEACVLMSPSMGSPVVVCPGD